MATKKAKAKPKTRSRTAPAPAAKPKARPMSKAKTKPVTKAKASTKARASTKAKPATRVAPKKASTAQKPTTHDEPVAEDLAEELMAQARNAMSLLFPEPQKKAPTPKATVAAILEHVDAIHAGKVRLAPREVRERCLALACLWGEAVTKQLGYEWRQVRWPGGGSIGIVEPNRRFALYPFPYIERIVEDRRADNTILLLFNMLVGGNVPKAAPNSYVTLG
jgi:hypothetical protein